MQIYALVDRGGGAPVTACTLIEGPLDAPNGIAYDRATGSLFVAETRRITRRGGAGARPPAGGVHAAGPLPVLFSAAQMAV